MEERKNRLLVLGGDGRYPWAVRYLRDRGMEVLAHESGGAPEEELDWAGHILLPLGVIREDRPLGGEGGPDPAMLPDLVRRGTTVLAGGFPTELERWYQSRGLICVSLLEQEPFLMDSAAVTAEGAVSILMGELDRSLAGAKVLVIGWGRIGRFLAGKLAVLGADVTVAARKSAARREIVGLNMVPEETGTYRRGLGDYDAVVNTVPRPVVTREQADQTKEHCLFLELASVPGGFPPGLEAVRNTNVARGLPAKYAPETAGKDLGRAVWESVFGEERTME